jgi:O-antigen biosynthesis protein WbqL
MPVFLPSIFPPFVYAHTQALLPDVPIVTFDPRVEYIRGERLFLPTWGLDHVYNESLCGQLDDLRVTQDAALPRRIFVSRRSRPIFRELDNLRELEEIAVQEGLTVVCPEDYPFERQIALFRGATMIVGEYGSALHNALFSPSGTLVFALNWINACQSRFARLRGHRIGYLLPSSGTEVVFSFDASFRHYTVDPTPFRARLREAMALPAASA